MTQFVKESLTRPVPRRAMCCQGRDLVVLPDRPSFWHRDPQRPCLIPARDEAAAQPRRAL